VNLQADSQWISINSLHEDAVSCLIDGAWDGKLVFVEDLDYNTRWSAHDVGHIGPCSYQTIDTNLHERPFFLCSKAGHVHPRRRFTLPQIIPLFLDGTK
jgi:hypothetical protein